MDIPQQKLTIVGWADPERMVKAIRKTRKTATICSHTEQPDPAAQPSDQKPENGAPPQEAANPPPPQAPPTESAPPAEPPQDQPPAPPPENPSPPQENPQPGANGDATNKQPQDCKPPQKDVGEVHGIYHHPHDYGYRYRYHNYEYRDSNSHWYKYPRSHGFRNEQPEPQGPPVYVTHSYSTYKPSPYVTEYEYIGSPPCFSHYRRTDQYYYGEDYRSGNPSNGNGNIMSVFSDENPNACKIM